MEKNIIKFTIKIFSGIFIVSTLIIYSMCYITCQSRISEIKERDINEVKSHHLVIEKIIDSLTSDVLYLANQPSMRKFENVEYLSENLLEYSLSKKNFDQVRFINTEGNEIIRINLNNGSPKIVEKRYLQNKIGRYYFEDTIKLFNKQIYISPLDLNIENGKVERPLKPVLRIGTPVFDYDNNKIGIIILNYLADNLLKEIKNDIRENYSSLQLLNQDGYWLYSQIKDEEWGFMFSGKLDTKFSNKYSNDVWNKISSNDFGQFTNKFGIFTYDTIHPLNIHHKSSMEISEIDTSNIAWENYEWKLISYISKTEINNLTKNIKLDYAIPWVLFIFFSIEISYIISKSLIFKKNAEEERFEAEKKYRLLFEEANESIVVTKEEKTIMANSRTLNFFEYNEKELLNIPLEALIYKDDRESVIKNQENQLNEDITSMVFEVRIITKTGKVKWTEIRSTKLDIKNEDTLLYFFLDISTRKKLETKLNKLARTDFLTGCYNRRYFTEELEKEIEKLNRSNNKLSIIMIDLDHFKKVNDTYGHDIGDIVLKKFSELTKKEIRKFDTFGRLGGEEFSIILPNSSEVSGFHCAERIRIAFEEFKFNIIEKQEKVSFTASFGVAEVKSGDNIESILKKADRALYKAKETGRNKTEIFK